jgi:hypothetical protein
VNRSEREADGNANAHEDNDEPGLAKTLGQAVLRSRAASSRRLTRGFRSLTISSR